MSNKESFTEDLEIIMSTHSYADDLELAMNTQKEMGMVGCLLDFSYVEDLVTELRGLEAAYKSFLQYLEVINTEVE